MDKIILLNKPKGMTSFDAANRCRKLLHEKKSGHTGTLDPNAEGLLIILFGKYTKFLPYCVHDHKRYEAEFELGYRTDTEDIWGEVLERREPAEHSEEEMNAAAEQFTKEYFQVPPMYSAIKKDGRKLYEYARRGVEVEREARLCRIDRIHVSKMDRTHWKLSAEVSSGTYIRTLITDLCKKTGELGVMSALKRTGIDRLSLMDAVTLEEIEEGHIPDWDIRTIISGNFSFYEADDPSDFLHGRSVKLPSCSDPVLMITHGGEILAAYEYREDGYYHCRRGLL